jgi:CheY-like chemotaxis protein
MQEQHGFAMRADPRLSRAQHPCPGGTQLIARGDDIVDFVADMVNATGRVLVKKPLNGRFRTQGVQKLDLGVGQVNEDDRNPVGRFGLRRADHGAQRITVLGGGGLQIGHGNGHVVQSSDHAVPLCMLGTACPLWWLWVRALAATRGEISGCSFFVSIPQRMIGPARILIAKWGPAMPTIDPADPGLLAARGPLPLQGMTLLAVEDSRFSSDALRLLCQRSGARLRRADSLRGAEAHLALYRPDVVLIDLGLPDGRGEALIRSLALRSPRLGLILGTSGDLDGRNAALAAGADGFFEKPIASLAAFQALILRHLPDRRAVPATDEGQIAPDPMSLCDDLKRAATLAAGDGDMHARRYLAGFVGGVARSTRDQALAAAADAVGEGGTMTELSHLLRDRIRATRDTAFDG